MSVLTTNQKGAIAEAAVVLERAKLAIPVLRPIDGRRYDLGLIRRLYQPGEIDAVAAYCSEIDTCYLLPTELSVDCNGVQLRLTPARNNQARRIRWAHDYELTARLKAFKGP